MDPRRRDELLAACSLLFDHTFDSSFLGHLQEAGLKSAWRRKALQTHPDRVVDRLSRMQHTERFIEARRAYGLLQEYLGRRTRHRAPAGNRTPPAPPPHQRTRSRRAAAPRRGDQPAGTSLPRRRLRLGEFLYHSRAITFSALIDALIWQRRQRDRFCEVGRRWRYLSESEVRLLLGERRPHERVGAAAQRLRLLNAFQVRTVLAFQQSRQEPLGNYFLQRGLLSPLSLQALVRRFERHNAAFSRR